MRVRSVLGKLLVLWLVVVLPASGRDSDVERLAAALNCTVNVAPLDRGRVVEEVLHAHAWNALLPAGPMRAVDHQFYSTDQVLDKVNALAPTVACVAHEFDLPPALLAGLLATELDLDYHLTDAVFDTLIRSGLCDALSYVEIGAGDMGVHFRRLHPALASLGDQFSPSSFYRNYYILTSTRTDAELTRLATRYPVIDLANGAVMARYYALLRIGDRPLAGMTVTDMAFIWSAYRSGVVGTPADPGNDHRWGRDYLRQASTVALFGDTIVALPYFAYYHDLFDGMRLRAHIQAGQGVSGGS